MIGLEDLVQDRIMASIIQNYTRYSNDSHDVQARAEVPFSTPRQQGLREKRLLIFLKYLLILPNIGIFAKSKAMRNNTSVALGGYFEQFVENRISQGRYKNASEVIRAGLRLLEEEENRVAALRSAIQEGLDSGIVADFDPQEHLKSLKAARKNG